MMEEVREQGFSRCVRSTVEFIDLLFSSKKKERKKLDSNNQTRKLNFKLPIRIETREKPQQKLPESSRHFHVVFVGLFPFS